MLGSLLVTLWALVCLVAAAPVEDTVAAGPLAWVEVPLLARAVAQMYGSPVGPLAPLVLPRADRAVVKNARDAHLLAAVYPGADGGPLEWVVALDGGGAAGSLRDALRASLARQAFTPGPSAPGDDASLQPFTRRGETVMLFAQGGRVGVASTPARAQPGLGVAPKPLSATPEYRRLSQLTPSDLRASLDVQRLYGILARTSQGRTLAGLVDRLGLLDAQALSSTVVFDRTRGAVVKGDLTVTGEPKGLRAVLGPAVVPAQPGAVPPGSTGFARLSVSPKRLWELAQIVASYEAPVETSLVRANLDALEARLGKSIGADLLGDAPRLWTVYLTPAGGPTTPVLLADVASGEVAAAFLKELAAVLPTLFPGLEAKASVADGTSVWVVAEKKRELLAIGVRRDTLVVGQTPAAVRAQLRRRPAADVPLPDPPAVVYGRFPPAAVRLGLERTDPGQRLLAAAAAKGLGEGLVTSALGTVSFSVGTVGAGYAFGVVAGKP